MSKDSEVNRIVREVQSLSLRLDKVSGQIKELKDNQQSNQSEVIDRLDRILKKLG